MRLPQPETTDAKVQTAVWRPSDPCALDHEWSNDYGDDWTPEVGTLCDCGKKRWGIAALPPPTHWARLPVECQPTDSKPVPSPRAQDDTTP
jgi:hypothetical protein